MRNETPAILIATVDRLAVVKAEIARLQDEEIELRSTLASCGLPEIRGTLHRATVSHCTGKTFIDWQTIAQHFKPSRQLVQAHKSKGDDYTTVRVTAYKTRGCNGQ